MGCSCRSSKTGLERPFCIIRSLGLAWHLYSIMSKAGSLLLGGSYKNPSFLYVGPIPT
jgi:hypothetical protein